MIYSDIKTSITAQFNATNGNRIVPTILGKPGGGKSACARDTLRAMGFVLDADVSNLDDATAYELTLSVLDPVDLMGTPDNTGPYTRWSPAEIIHRLRRGTGRRALLLEEFTDASVPVQNASCQLVYDRRMGPTQLTDDLYIVATGNRTEDKSGANRMTSKLANRVRFYDFVESIDDWSNWALDAGIDPVLIQFLRFRPNLLSDFDPNRRCNPTPRSWERVSLIPIELPGNLYFENVAGEVGEGAAATYAGFRKIYETLPDITGILLNPKAAPVPTEPQTLYALTGALASRASKDNFDRVVAYVGRLPAEFSVMCINDAIKLKPEVRTTAAFRDWATTHYKVLL